MKKVFYLLENKDMGKTFSRPMINDDDDDEEEEKEEWRPINDYENYEISNMGRVKNVKTRNILKGRLVGGGYFQVALSKCGIRKDFYINQLVAMHFIPNHNNYKIVDHINHDMIDNRTINLRWANKSSNAMNQYKQKRKTSSKYKGVHWRGDRKKWRTQIRLNSKLITIGHFDNEEDAGRAYNEKAKELFGEFACLNEID